MAVFFLRRGLAGKKATSLAVGESLYIEENGELTEYFVVQQGNPNSSTYTDAGADGTWIMRRDVSDVSIVRATQGNCTTILTNYLGRFSEEVQAAFVEITLPRKYYMQNVALVNQTELTSKIHLPSVRELDPNATGTGVGTDNAVLEYFSGDTDEKRIAYLNGAASSYYLYEEYAIVDVTNNIASYTTYYVGTGGQVFTNQSAAISYGIRPLMILSPDAKLDSGNVLKGV